MDDIDRRAWERYAKHSNLSDEQANDAGFRADSERTTGYALCRVHVASADFVKAVKDVFKSTRSEQE